MAEGGRPEVEHAAPSCSKIAAADEDTTQYGMVGEPPLAAVRAGRHSGTGRSSSRCHGLAIVRRLTDSPWLFDQWVVTAPDGMVTRSTQDAATSVWPLSKLSNT